MRPAQFRTEMLRAFSSRPGRAILGLVVSATLAAQSPQYTIFGAGCAGSMQVARMAALNPPAIGFTLQVDLTNLPLNLAFMVTGLSSTSSPLGPLPLDLGPRGMPGCVAYVSPDTTVLVLGSGNQATYTLAIPAAPSLAGMQFFQQALVIDWLAGNAAGVVLSDAAMAVVGAWPAGTPVANMIPIWPGMFLMGSDAGPPDSAPPYFSRPTERPVHQVTISQPFWIGRYEVTQAEYQAVMSGVSGANPNPSFFAGANLPVEQVTWIDAMSFCAELTAQQTALGRVPAGYQYRLATEAEWEYCCRAGSATTTEFHYGDGLLCGQAQFSTSFHPHPSSSTCGTSGTVAVGSFQPNAWGLYDMHGNVWEWCLDAWDGVPNYTGAAATDPYISSGSAQVRRGGGWTDSSASCRTAFRYTYAPTASSSNIGFRLVLGPVLSP